MSPGPTRVKEQNISGCVVASPVQSAGVRPAKWAWSIPRYLSSWRIRSLTGSAVALDMLLPLPPRYVMVEGLTLHRRRDRPRTCRADLAHSLRAQRPSLFDHAVFRMRSISRSRGSLVGTFIGWLDQSPQSSKE